MTIGSVPPHKDHHCVRRVTFRDINFEYPMKAIYVKTNPGDVGTGQITDILYERIKIHFPVWWNIYIGPQQQKEPDGRGPGCMFYPFGGDCETQPRIDVRNITLRNLTSTGGFLPPGVIRCNETNPCKDINFENVDIRGWWEYMHWTFISEYADGNIKSAYPDPSIGNASHRVFELKTPMHIVEFVLQVVNLYDITKEDITAWEVLFGFVIWGIQMII